jgi:diguanylate cyclase (GGDEF)-like protein
MFSIAKTITYKPDKKDKSLILALSFLIALIIGFIDYVLPMETSLEVFYLIPIAMVSWFIGEWPGILISILSAVFCLMDDLFGTGIHSSSPLVTYWNWLARIIFFGLFVLVISRLKNALEHEAQSARTDSLTGIANSKRFFEITNYEIERARRYKHPFTVAYFDLDNFKEVNDQFGHSIGDVLLVHVAEIVKKNIRPTDVIARLGGDEFAILLPETEEAPAKEFLGRLHEQLLAKMNKEGWPITFSIGEITFNSPPSSADEVLHMTDSLMYEAKKSGKNMIKYDIFPSNNGKNVLKETK